MEGLKGQITYEYVILTNSTTYSDLSDVPEQMEGIDKIIRC